MQNTQSLTHKNTATGTDISRVVWSFFFPVAVFFLCIFTISYFKAYGQGLVAPLTGVMWIVGALVAFWMPMQRKAVISETLTMIATYNGSLLALQQLVAITSGASAQMLTATFGQATVSSVANTVPGFLQNALFITTVMLPLGYLGMQGKRVLSWRRQKSVQKTMESMRAIRGK